MRVVVAIAGALALSTSASMAEQRQGSVVHVTEADGGRTIRVPIGLEIRARIAQPSGTRLRWEVRDDSHLEPLDHPQSLVSYGTGMGKGREFRLFRLRVVQPGRFPLVFGLVQPDEQADRSPQQRIVINVDAPRYDGDNGPRPNPDWQEGDGPDTIEPLNQRDAYRQIDVQVGREMTIALPSNGAGGFYWDAAALTNVRILGIREERVRNGTIGGGGTSLVQFRVLRPGRAEITLVYVSPDNGAALRTLKYILRGV